VESEQEREERLFRQAQQPHVMNPPLPPRAEKVPPSRPRNKSLVKKQTGKEPRAFPKVKASKVPPSERVHHKARGIFRFQGKHGFLTWPQYKGGLTPVEVMERTKMFFASKNLQLQSAICALENHSNDEKEQIFEDPGVHYHVIFKVAKRIDTTNCNYFDEILEQHGNYVPCRQFLNSVVYATKENNYSLFNLDISAIRKAIESKTSVAHHTVASKILAKPFRTMKKITEKWPGYVLQHQNKVQDFVELVQSFQEEELLPYYGVQIEWPTVDNPAPHAISSWVSNNFDGKERPHKTKQLFVWGATNMGKSHILIDLAKRFTPYIIGTEEKFDRPFDNFKHKFAIFDEFCGGKQVWWLNTFLEGGPMQLNLKNSRNGCMKKVNIPVIFCSNKSFEQIYEKLKNENPFQYEALYNRFQHVQVTQQFRLQFLPAPVEVMREEAGLNPNPRAQEEGEGLPYPDDESFAETLTELSDLNYKGELVIEEDDEEEESEEPPPSQSVLKRTKRINLVQEDDSEEGQMEFVRPKKVNKKVQVKKKRKRFLKDSDEEESPDLK